MPWKISGGYRSKASVRWESVRHQVSHDPGIRSIAPLSIRKVESAATLRVARRLIPSPGRSNSGPRQGVPEFASPQAEIDRVRSRDARAPGSPRKALVVADSRLRARRHRVDLERPKARSVETLRLRLLRQHNGQIAERPLTVAGGIPDINFLVGSSILRLSNRECGIPIPQGRAGRDATR